MRVLSGIQPSGKLHLGNYFGAMAQHLALGADEANECFFFIANLHAMTTVKDAALLRQWSLDVALDYLALGLDGERVAFFLQSDVPQIPELTWYMGTVEPMARLELAHSYKDKIAKGIPPDFGLFAYPVLMAADILAYRSESVPVGADQKQHVEMTRDMAERFNRIYGDILTLPEARILPEVAVVPGIDGQKMSKSYGNTIEIFAEPAEIETRVMGIVTDSTPLAAPKAPDACNVFALLKLFADASETADWADRYRKGGTGYGHAKKRLVELITAHFAEARQRRKELAADPKRVHRVLTAGAERARGVAEGLLTDVRKAVGILRPQ
jgi:tryptophanyl-tRNA synthetase